MPRPRKYKTNAERQAAYRERKRRREAVGASPAGQAITERVLAEWRRAEGA